MGVFRIVELRADLVIGRHGTTVFEHTYDRSRFSRAEPLNPGLHIDDALIDEPAPVAAEGAEPAPTAESGRVDPLDAFEKPEVPPAPET